MSSVTFFCKTLPSVGYAASMQLSQCCEVYCVCDVYLFVIFDRNLRIFEFTEEGEGVDVHIRAAQLLRLRSLRGAR